MTKMRKIKYIIIQFLCLIIMVWKNTERKSLTLNNLFCYYGSYPAKSMFCAFLLFWHIAPKKYSALYPLLIPRVFLSSQTRNYQFDRGNPPKPACNAMENCRRSEASLQHQSWTNSTQNKKSGQNFPRNPKPEFRGFGGPIPLLFTIIWAKKRDGFEKYTFLLGYYIFQGRAKECTCLKAREIPASNEKVYFWEDGTQSPQSWRRLPHGKPQFQWLK